MYSHFFANIAISKAEHPSGCMKWAREKEKNVKNLFRNNLHMYADLATVFDAINFQ